MKRRHRSAPTACHFEVLERRVLFVLYGPDISFGNGGVAAGPAGNQLLAELPDGKILAVGVRRISVDQDFDTARDAHRLNPDGTIDRTFANGAGVISLGDTGGAILAGTRFCATVASTGVAGADHDRVVAYTTDGVLDTAFSGDGSVPLPSTMTVDESVDNITGGFLGVAPGGGVVLLVRADDANGTDYEEVVKLTSDGSVDTTFGDGGFLRLPADAPNVDALWTRNGVIISRTPGYQQPADITYTRYLPDGSAVDPTFGAGGTVTFPSLVYGFAEQPDGKLLIVRSPDADPQALTRRLYRLNADGSPDTSFGESGSVPLADARFSSEAAEVSLDPQQHILVDTGGRLNRFGAAGAAQGAPFDGSFDFGRSGSGVAGKLILDSGGRVLRGGTHAVTRFDVLQPVAIGRDDVLYVHGDDATGDTAVVTADGVHLNGTFTSIDTAAIVGVTLNLAGGDNAAVTASHDLPVTVNTGGGADTITTGDGDDRISAGQGNNVLRIGHGNDFVDIASLRAADRPTDHHQITGGDGSKDITVWDGRATIRLGTGDSKVAVSGSSNEIDVNDHITIAGGSNDISMSWGRDVLEIAGSGNNNVFVSSAVKAATITTGDGNDTFNLLSASTVHSNGGDDSFQMQTHGVGESLLIFAGDGDDRIAARAEGFRCVATIHGGNGHDYVRGGFGGQTVYGGAGNDTLWGGGGSDLLSAGGGNDRLYGEGGNDRLYGGNGRDRIYGGAHDDRLRGGAQGDWIYGQRGSDQLDGGGGHDRLYADYAAGLDMLRGGNGDDLLVSRDGLADELVGGPGDDTAVADEADDVTGV